MRKHNCPYLNRNGTCINKRMDNGDCIYKVPADCPYLTSSKAWSVISRFFRRKAPHSSLKPLKTPQEKQSR